MQAGAVVSLENYRMGANDCQAGASSAPFGFVLSVSKKNKSGELRLCHDGKSVSGRADITIRFK